MYMEINLIGIGYLLLFVDSLLVIVFAFGNKEELWNKKLGPFAKHFPLARGWAATYHIAVLMFGCGLWALGYISF